MQTDEMLYFGSDPDEMLHSGSRLFAKVPILRFPVYKGLSS